MYTHNTWNIEAARRLYSIQHWGDGYFDINAAGNVAMCVPGNPAQQVDLHALAMRVHNEDGMRFPLLVRFVNVLHDRVQRLQGHSTKRLPIAGKAANTPQFTPSKSTSNVASFKKSSKVAVHKSVWKRAANPNSWRCSVQPPPAAPLFVMATKTANICASP